MLLEAKDPRNGNTVKFEAPDCTEDSIRDLLEFDFSDEELRRRISTLDLSADAKSVLYTIAKVSVRAGSMIVRIGRKILDGVMKIMAEFPSATSGTILGATLGFLVSSIPFVGLVLGPIAAPLFAALGLVLGAKQDIRDKMLLRRIAEANAAFDPLKT
ncbi:hypothetical protein ACQ5SP_03680 [Rhodovulum sp. YNF3179]